MKEKIILLVIGALAGAVISTGAFLIYTNSQEKCDCTKEQTQMKDNQRPEMPNGQMGENGQPPEMPNDNNRMKKQNDNNNNKESKKTKSNTNTETN